MWETAGPPGGPTARPPWASRQTEYHQRKAIDMMDRYRLMQEKRAATHEGGFTLIELLIVIVVLGILAAVTVFALGGVTGQSAQSACNADAKSTEVAVEAFRSQKGVWPTVPADLT